VPIARYFILVGGTLAALLFIAGWYFPAPPAMFANQTTVFDETIRIRSEHKWPEKIVLDTSRPTMMPLAVEERRVAQLVPLPSDGPGDQSSLEAKPSGSLIHGRPPSINGARKSSVARGKGRSINACGRRPHCAAAGKSGTGRRLLSVWVVDRQWSNKHECYTAPASCGAMA
jgi:hypothetical protein